VQVIHGHVHRRDPGHQPAFGACREVSPVLDLCYACRADHVLIMCWSCADHVLIMCLHFTPYHDWANAGCVSAVAVHIRSPSRLHTLRHGECCCRARRLHPLGQWVTGRRETSSEGARRVQDTYSCHSPRGQTWPTSPGSALCCRMRWKRRYQVQSFLLVYWRSAEQGLTSIGRARRSMMIPWQQPCTRGSAPSDARLFACTAPKSVRHRPGTACPSWTSACACHAPVALCWCRGALSRR